MKFVPWKGSDNLETNTIQLFGRKVGNGYPVFIVAEIGVNHNGDLNLARQLVEVAAEAGADAVKFQTLNAARYISRYAPKARYQLAATEKGESQVDMVSKYEFTKAQHIDLIEFCAEREVHFFSTSFEEDGVDLLQDVGVGCFKIPSGEVNNIPLIEYIAEKKKPTILSTGMSSIGEVERAVEAILSRGVQELAILHCVSNYPASPRDANLLAMHTMERAFGFPVGYSDHTPGIEIALAAVALGACIIEKHFTLDKTLPGPDHQASLEPEELKEIVRAIRNIEISLGDGIKRSMPSEENTRDVARKSLVAALPIEAGEILVPEMIAIKRPGTGIAPTEIPYVVGRKMRRGIKEDELFSWEMFD